MNIYDWAARWGIPHPALVDLQHLLGVGVESPVIAAVPGKSEAAVQAAVRLEATRRGCRLWRNNVGAGVLEDGSYLRWGLANESAQMNKNVKSSDLIGIRPRLVEFHHVGQVWGVFLSREVKPADWRYTGTEREVAQRRWLELVVALGGDACFVNGEGTL